MDQDSKISNAIAGQQEIYASLLEDMPGMVCRFQLDGTIQYANQAYCRSLARKPEELIGKTFHQFLPPEITAELTAQLKALTPESPVVTIEHPVITTDGQKRWHRWTNRLLTDGDGRTIAYQSFGLDITEQKVAAQKLEESEKILRVIAENFPRSYLSIVNPDLTIGFTSGQEFKRQGIDPNQFVGMHIREVFANQGEEVVEKVTLAYHEAFAGRPQSFGLTVGEQLQWYESVPLVNEQGKIDKILAVVQNITERVQTETALRRSENRYRAIVEDLVELLVRFDADGTVTYANEGYEALFGHLEGGLVGRNLFEQLDKPIARLVKEKIRRLTPENPVVVDEHAERVADGRIVWFSWIDRGIFDENGRLVEIQGVGHDITSRRETEDRLRRSETQLNRIIDTVPEGVILLGSDKTILRTNPVAESYLSILAPGWQDGTVENLGDRLLVELLTSPPKGLWHEVAAAGQTFEVIVKPIQYNISNAGWVVVLRDVTQEREIQQRVKQQERLAAVGQLAAGIAHDFNNVMAVIILYVETILRSVHMPPRARERMYTINQQALRAADLVQQILDFSRQSVLQRRSLDLLPFMKELVKLLERTLPEHVKIELSFDSDSYLVEGDPSRIQQMMMNLAVNARDAMPDGGLLRIVLDHKTTNRPRTLPIREMPPGEWVRVRVSDTGPGIPPEALAHIFEPFFTTKEVGRGTGLGLAQVFGIVQQHDGYIDVATVPGGGTTFTVYFPAQFVSATPELVPDRTAVRPGYGQKILVVEDNHTTREALVDTLEMLNYRVVEAANGREALRTLETTGQEIALILSDVVMPEMGGVALLQALRDQNITTPIIFLSGHPLSQELEDLPALGLAGWILKPPNLVRLSHLMANALYT